MCIDRCKFCACLKSGFADHFAIGRRGVRLRAARCGRQTKTFRKKVCEVLVGSDQLAKPLVGKRCNRSRFQVAVATRIRSRNGRDGEANKGANVLGDCAANPLFVPCPQGIEDLVVLPGVRLQPIGEAIDLEQLSRHS
jgi:hypothetical protein